MPSIVDLLNNLPNFQYYSGQGNFSNKSVPYGKDQPGGGWSGQPFIVHKEGETWSPSATDDGLVQGGIIGATNRSLADVERITKFFTDTAKGPLFLAKQAALQLTNPALEQPVNGSGATTGIAGVANSINSTLGPTRIYNLGVNTLAEVGSVAFGLHFYRNGLSPIMDDDQKYASVVAANNSADLNPSISQDAGNRLVKTEATLFNSANLVVNEYGSGPNSVYGVGNTVIRRTVDTIGDSAVNQDKEGNFTPIKVSDLAKIGIDGIMVVNGGTSFDTTKQDFRQLKNILYNADLQSSDYANLNIEKRISRGNPGSNNQDRSSYANTLLGTQDLINQLSLFYAANPPGIQNGIYDLNSGAPVTAPSVRDIIKFRIESVDNDSPENSIWMVFRATITDFNDNTDTELNKYKYSGRGESFYVGNGAEEEYTFGFTIVAQSRGEMKPLYQKLNYLKSTMWPDYNKANKMRTNITKLTIGDMIYRQPGFITSLNISIPEGAYWEIALNEPEGGLDANMHEVPMMLKVSMNFIPIYDFLPRKGASTPFISVTGRKSPSDPLSPPAPNNWLADSGTSNNSDGSVRYTSLQDKISALRKHSS